MQGAATIPFSLTLLHLAGAVALLLWGTRMVKLGFTRAYGTSLRRAIAAGTKNRFIGFFCGAFTTTLLQSSTATTVLLASFVKKHGIALSAALGVVLGADVATTLIAQVLTFDLSWLSPAFLIAGIMMHMIFEHGGRKRHLARVLIGLGLMLLSLTLIREVSAPIKNSDLLPVVMEPLKNDPALALILATLLTWLFHSSLAAVLLFGSLASHNIIPTEILILLVAGANIGGLLSIFGITYKEGPTARRITLSVLGMKVAGIVCVFIFMPQIIEYFTSISPDKARLAVNFHTGFNVAVAIVFLPLTSFIAKFMEKLIPDETTGEKPAIQYIEDHMLSTPVVALAAAARETLHMAELVEDMFKKSLKALETGNEATIRSLRKADATIDEIYNATKLYLTRLSQEGLDPKEADRYIQILTFATNLEHIGDIIDKSLLDMAEIKAEQHEEFSEEGFTEIKDFHGRVLENMKLAQAIFMSEDPKLAAKLVEEKGAIRAAAEDTSNQHFKRLQSGKRESIATSSLHLDIIRDYKRINSYITRVAFAIIENAENHKAQRKDS